MKKNIQQLIKIIEFWRKSAQKEQLYERELIKKIDYRSKEVVDLIGPRRSGKSSILKLIVRRLAPDNNFLFLNFEDPFFVNNNKAGIIEEAVEVFQEYFNPKVKYLFFDEIQRIDQWERAVRKLRDSGEFKIFITGSSSKLMGGEISSLLTGRHLSYAVFPISFKEFLYFKGMELNTKKDFILKDKTIFRRFHEYLKTGGFPEAVKTANTELLKNYFFDILQKDIVMRYAVREKEVLEKMAFYLLSNSSKIISLESLKGAFNISYAIVSSYLEYLKEAMIVFELSQFSYSLKKQHKALKKIYAVDTGLSNAVSFRFSEDKGRMLENLVFLELKRRKKEIYYYKTKNGLEVDFLVKKGNKPKELLQVAWDLADIKTKERELKALFEAMEELNFKKAVILTDNEDGILKEGKKEVVIKPVYRWLLED